MVFHVARARREKGKITFFLILRRPRIFFQEYFLGFGLKKNN